MSDYSAELTNAIESDCSHSMEPLMQAKRKEDFDDMLAILATDESSQAKARSLYALGRWGDTKAVSTINKAIPSFDEICKLTAADALGRLNSAPALEGIVQLSQDTSPHVRKVAAKALSRFDNAKAQKALEAMVKVEKESFVKDYSKKLVTDRKKS